MSDNHIKLPATALSFGAADSDDFPTTGQDHDDYPEPGQARYDHMRGFLIALLSHQSSLLADIPTEGRTGSIWFPEDLGYFYYSNDDAANWESIASAIGLVIAGTDSEDNLSLADWYAEAQPVLDGIQPKSTWSGSANNSGITSIPVPESLQEGLALIKDIVRPTVYIEGALVDPRNCEFGGCADIVDLLGGVELNKGERFTVIIEKFDNFIIDEIVVSG